MKKNDQIVFNLLVKESKKRNPINISFQNISDKIQFERMVTVKVIKEKKQWKPSRQAVDRALKYLQKEGKIDLDYSDKWNPRIKVNPHK